MIGLWFFVDHSFGLGDLKRREQKWLVKNLLVMSPFLFFSFFLGGLRIILQSGISLGLLHWKKELQGEKKKGELHLERRGRG